MSTSDDYLRGDLEHRFPDENFSDGLMARLKWVSQQTGLHENLVMRVLSVAAMAPDSEGSAHRGFLLYNEGPGTESVFPLWEVQKVADIEGVGGWTKFEVYGEATE